MNLVFVGSSPRAWGSEQNFVSLARGCHDAGHGVIAVVRADSEVATLLQQAGVRVHATPFRGGADPRAMLAVVRAVRELRADWIVTPHQKHFWPLYALARLSGAQLAVFRHLVFIRSWLTRVVFPKLTDRFFVVSDFALEALVRAGAPATRLTRLYNPIDLRRFRPDPIARARIRAQLNLPADALLVGFVGRHESGKGVHILREALHQAMHHCPRIHAVWVGGGPELCVTKNLLRASEHRHRHRFIDWVRTPEHYYAAMDCMVTPSQAPETFGRVVAEAQACGVPIIASTAGGLREAFVDGVTGVAFTGSDPTILAGKILGLALDPVRCAEMGSMGQQFVQRFDSELIVGEFVSQLLHAHSVGVAKPWARAPRWENLEL